MARIIIINEEEDYEDEGRRMASLLFVTQTGKISLVWLSLAMTDYQICISCGFQVTYDSSLKEHIMLLFFRICLGKNVWKLQASNCGLKLFAYHP